MANIVNLSPSMLKAFFRMGEAILNLNKEDVNALNVFPVPDGDTGTNMGLTLKSAIKSLDLADTVKEICSVVSMGALMGARGNSGVILSQILRGFTGALQDKRKINGKTLAKALQSGVNIAYKSVLKPVEGTILTVGRAVANGALEKAEEEEDIVAILEYALQMGRIALENTPNLLPVLKEAGVVDAGGKGFLYILQGGIMGLKGETVADLPEEPPATLAQITDAIVDDLPADAEDLVFQYCTEFLIKDTKAAPEKVRARLQREGDSLIVVGDGGVIKVHIHTNDPGKVLSFAAGLGDLLDIKIENMKEQILERQAAKAAEKPKIRKGSGIVAVASGDGMAEIFKSMGVDVVINGGQTMNPSAEDVLNSIDAVPAAEVVILPNNSNIILTARQTEKMAEKPVTVVPTKFVTQGIQAVLNFNPELSAADNGEAMAAELEAAVHCEITYAVRDTAFNGFDIKANDILALANGDIVAVGKEVGAVTLELLKNAMIDDAELLTSIMAPTWKRPPQKPWPPRPGPLIPTWRWRYTVAGSPYISIMYPLNKTWYFR